MMMWDVGARTDRQPRHGTVGLVLSRMLRAWHASTTVVLSLVYVRGARREPVRKVQIDLPIMEGAQVW